MLDDPFIHIIKKLDSLMPGSLYLGRESKQVLVHELAKDTILLENLAALQRDVEKMRQLYSPSIAAIHEIREDEKNIYLLMDQPQGTKLVEIMNALEQREKYTVMLRIAEALSSIHQQGVLHGGLHPDIVFVNGDDEFSCILSGHLVYRIIPVSGLVLNEKNNYIAYISPEQAWDAHMHINARSDLYSLGCIYYEMLSGVPPFYSTDNRKLLDLHKTEKPSPLPGIPGKLSEIVLKLLEKDPDNRYSSTDELIIDIKKALFTPMTGEQDNRLERKPDPQLVSTQKIFGRDSELRNLMHGYANAINGFGQVVFISGEPGVGKTALLHSFLAATSKDKRLFFSYYCDESTVYTPYAPIIAMIHEFLNQQNTGNPLVREIISSLGDRTSYFLNLISHEWREKFFSKYATISTLANTYDRRKFFDSIYAFFDLVAQSVPVLVLAIDNMQNIDSNSFDLIQYLVKKISNSNIIIVSCLQNTQPKQMSRVRELQKMNNVIQLGVTPFNKKQIPALVNKILAISQEFEPVFYAKIYDNSLGIPLLVNNIIKILLNYHVVVIDATSDGYTVNYAMLNSLNINNNIISLVRKRLKIFSREERDILEMASVTGKEFSVKDVAKLYREIKGYNDKGLVTIVMEKARQGQLWEQVSETRWVFCHDKIQEAIYNSINSQVKATYHVMCAAMLELENRDDIDRVVFQVAYHYNNSAHNEKMLEYNERAYKKSLSLYSLPEAMYYLRTMLDYYISNKVYDKQLADLVIQVSAVMHACGNVTESFLYLEEVLRLFSNEINPMDEIRIVNAIAAGHYYLNHLGKAIMFCEQALNLAKKLDDYPDFGNLYFILGSTKWFVGDMRGSIEFLNSAIACFAEHNAMRLAALAMRSACYLFRGDIKQASDDVTIIESHLNKTGDPIVLPQLFHCASLYYAWSHTDYEKAIGYSLASYEKAKKDSNILFMYSSMVGMATVYYYQGKVEQAKQKIKESIKISQANNIYVGIHFVQALEAEIDAASGDIYEANDNAVRYLQDHAGEEVLSELLYLKVRLLCEEYTGAAHDSSSLLTRAYRLIVDSGMYLLAGFFEEYYHLHQTEIYIDSEIYARFTEAYAALHSHPSFVIIHNKSKELIALLKQGEHMNRERVFVETRTGINQKDMVVTCSLTNIIELMAVCETSDNIEELSGRVVVEVARLLHFEQGCVVFNNAEFFPTVKHYFTQNHFDMVKEIIREVQRSGKMFIFPGQGSDDAKIVNSIVQRNAKSVVCIPFATKTRSLGCLYLQNNIVQQPLVKQDIDALQVIMPYVSYIIENLMLQTVVAEQGQNKATEKKLIEASRLTRREAEMLKLIIFGMSNREIAESFGVSEATVKSHVYNIFKKMKVRNRIDLIKRLT